MSIVVEDGTLVDGANSYVSLEEADEYFTTYGDTLWTETASDEAKERALLMAAQYMTQKWRLRWMGSRIEAFQAMDWPRTGVPVVDFFDPFQKNPYVPPAFQNTTFVPETMIPVEIKTGQLLLASASLSDDGQSSTSLQQLVGRITKKEKAAVLEVEYFAPTDGVSSRATEYYWDAENMIKIYLRAGSRYSGQLVRA